LQAEGISANCAKVTQGPGNASHSWQIFLLHCVSIHT